MQQFRISCSRSHSFLSFYETTRAQGLGAAYNLMPGSPVETGAADTPLRRGFPAFCLDESKTLWLPAVQLPPGHGTKPLGARGPPSPEGGCLGPAAAPLPAPHGRSQPVPGSGCAFPSSSSGLREINRSSGACSQPSFPCDPSELRLRQRALFPGPAEGMFYS